MAWVLSAAAAAQPSDKLLSFDSDLPELLAATLCARHERVMLAETGATN